MKNLYTIFLFAFLISTHAQVGINTDTPNPGVALDVDGKTNVEHRIYLGDVSLNNPGDPGTNNELIVSGGSDDNPVWDVKRLPDGFGETFTMTYMHSGYDVTGAQLGADGSISYPENMPLNSTTSCTGGNCWKVLPELNHTFPIYKNSNKVNFVFQTVIQTNVSGNTSYACGIFLNSTASAGTANPPAGDFVLVGVRNDVILSGTANDYRLFNMNVTLTNLVGSAAGKKHEVRAACRGRVNGEFAYAGRPITPANTTLNSEMARSALNIFVLESWE